MNKSADNLKRRLISPVEPPNTPLEAFGGPGHLEPEEPIEKSALREQILHVLRGIFDPEIPVNIYDLGLIYGFDLDDDASVEIQMTLTAPACPVAGSLVQDVADRVGKIPGISRSHVKLVWDPPWTQDRMSEEAKLELGLL